MVHQFLRSHRLPISYCHLGVMLAAVEWVAVFSAVVAASCGYHVFIGGAFRLPEAPWGLAAGCATMFVLGMQAQRLYRPAIILHPGRIGETILATWTAAFCAVVTAGFLAKATSQTSRATVVLSFVVGAIMLPGVRQVAKSVLNFLISNHAIADRRHVVLIGDRRQLASHAIGEKLARHGYKIARQFSVTYEGSDSMDVTRGMRTVLDDLKNFQRDHRVDEIFLAFAATESRIVEIVSGSLREVPVPVRLLFDRSIDNLVSKPIVDLGAARSVRLQTGPLTSWQQVCKRSLDILVASLGLALLSPVLVCAALAVRFDSPGPIIFRQRRAGFNGKTFYIFKFRSMTTMDDGQKVLQAVRGDKRVTKVGRFLRSTSIDELPQLLNVLRGEMSIVGPRPHALSHDDQYAKIIATYALRHHMKPGITGWAQVNGCRGETSSVASMEARIERDLWYIAHWSLWLDIRAILLTFTHLMRAPDAY